jgi:glycosyltransferase involved in cell wall biosynthesis
MITVITPTNNSESFICDLLNSLNEQTFKQFELYVIDDHSEDNTTDVISSYNCQFPVKIFESLSEGPGSARNLGLMKSKKKYVTFIDSDDTVHKKYLEYLVALATETNADIVESLYRSTDFNEKTLNIPKLTSYLSNESRVIQLLGGSFSRIACGKLYKRSLLTTSSINFSEDIRNGEDHIFSLRAYNTARSFQTVYRYLYNWRRREDSLTKKNINEKTITDFLYVNSTKFQFISELENHDLYFEAWAIRFFQEVKVLAKEIEDKVGKGSDAKNLLKYLHSEIVACDYYPLIENFIINHSPETIKSFEKLNTHKGF